MLPIRKSFLSRARTPRSGFLPHRVAKGLGTHQYWSSSLVDVPPMGTSSAFRGNWLLCMLMMSRALDKYAPTKTRVRTGGFPPLARGESPAQNCLGMEPSPFHTSHVSNQCELHYMSSTNVRSSDIQGELLGAQYQIRAEQPELIPERA